MRITNTIRDYVTNEITEKFNARLSEVGKQYEADREKLCQKLTDLCNEATAKADEIARGMGFERRVLWNGNHPQILKIDYNAYERPEECKMIDDTRAALNNRRRKIIDDILISLELGETTKGELKSVMDSIEVDI